MRPALAFLLLGLAACERGGDTGGAVANNGAAIARPAAAPPGATPRQPAGTSLAEPEAEPSQPQPVEADPNAVTRAWFAGRWTDTGDCADAGEFAPNGTYRLADGTRGMWNVQGGRLVVQHAEGRNVARLKRLDDTTIEVAADDGSVGRSTRC